jgi:hypothetical protein
VHQRLVGGGANEHHRFDSRHGGRHDVRATPGAMVVLTRTATGLTQHAMADAAGRYVFARVEPGTYSVAAELRGFRRAQRGEFVVNVNDALVLDFTLQPGEVTENVVVDADAPRVQTHAVLPGGVPDAPLRNHLVQRDRVCDCCDDIAYDMI